MRPRGLAHQSVERSVLTNLRHKNCVSENPVCPQKRRLPLTDCRILSALGTPGRSELLHPASLIHDMAASVQERRSPVEFVKRDFAHEACASLMICNEPDECANLDTEHPYHEFVCHLKICFSKDRRYDARASKRISAMHAAPIVNHRNIIPLPLD
jgi:hypothetical protein